MTANKKNFIPIQLSDFNKDILAYLEKHYGINYISCYNKTEDKRVLYSTYPTRWLDIYTHNDYDECDLPVISSTNSLYPYLWGEKSFAKANLKQVQILTQAQEYSINAGISFFMQNSLNTRIITASSNYSQHELECIVGKQGADIMFLLKLISEYIELIYDDNLHKRFLRTKENYIVRVAMKNMQVKKKRDQFLKDYYLCINLLHHALKNKLPSRLRKEILMYFEEAMKNFNKLKDTL